MIEFEFGIDHLLRDQREILSNKRFGLLVNQASVTSSLDYTFDVLVDSFPNQLGAIFSPQHGLWGEQQANMIETDHHVHSKLGIPIYSLYRDTRWPTDKMLSDLDCLVVDLQDVGTRVFTYIWTLSYCLEACAKNDVQLLVLDRPNPLGGLEIEGPILRSEYSSFVGRYEIPMRHGFTIGEFAAWANRRYSLNARLEIIAMNNWSRSQLWCDLDRAWVPPSPNMPRFETAVVYPGQVLLEGTNLSEGRGTTRPFEVIGAPFIDAQQLADRLCNCDFQCPGVKFLPIRFEPRFDKWTGESCGGVAIHVTNPRSVRSYAMTLHLLEQIQHLWPREFAWTSPPYEYETEKMPIDILSGDTVLRTGQSTGIVPATNWHDQVMSHYLYS